MVVTLRQTEDDVDTYVFCGV